MSKTKSKIKTSNDTKTEAPQYDEVAKYDPAYCKKKLLELKEHLALGARYMKDAELGEWCLNADDCTSPGEAARLAEEYDIGLVRIPDESNSDKWDGVIVMRLAQYKNFLLAQKQLAELGSNAAGVMHAV